MTNLDVRMEQLREQMAEKYLSGDKNGALEISCRLDKLIALAQREKVVGQAIICAGKRKQ